MEPSSGLERNQLVFDIVKLHEARLCGAIFKMQRCCLKNIGAKFLPCLCAESLSLLLRHLVDHSLQKPREHLKEFQLTVDVFGRAETFDPRLDSRFAYKPAVSEIS